MVQRVQSLLLLFSSLSILAIVFYIPILKDLEKSLLIISNSFPVIKYIMIICSFLLIFTIFKFNKMHIQRIIIASVNFSIALSLVVIVFLLRKDSDIVLGVWSFLIPFTSLKLASFFIKKDEKLLKSSDRIR